jgi:endonuclease/exonuclease/phosphatase family metal-dependent hydrolase
VKKLSYFNKFVFISNIIFALITFIGYILPFLAPRLFPLLSVFTLFLPLMLICNLLFFGYWLIQVKRQMLLSGVVLLIGITFITKFYKFKQTNLPATEEDFLIMSYNVRLFNLYNWFKNDNLHQEISRFIKEQNPDILCIQEFSYNNSVDFRIFPYQYLFVEGKKTKLGQAIFSKYPIFNKGIIEFPSTTNNAIFADLKRGKDTIRVYSIHMQSVKITPDVHELESDPKVVTQERSKRMLQRLSASFRIQQSQAEIIKKHKQDCNYPVIIAGDMNNSAFSYVYRSIKGELLDAFEEAGSGFGKTYNFKYYPARIDYIFTDKIFEVRAFENFPNFVNSDHFPIAARIRKRD